MANVITDETIDYVGILAKLELSAEEKEQAKRAAVEKIEREKKMVESYIIDGKINFETLV